MPEKPTPMKNTLILAMAFLFAISIGCRKNNTNEPQKQTNQPIPVQPDLSVKITASVAGYVTDETNSPVVFAMVSAGDKQATTDQYGYFEIANASLPKTAAVVRVTKPGLFNGYRTFTPQGTRESLVRIQLLAKKEIGIVDAASGGSAATAEGGTVTLSPNSVVVAADASVYTGPVHISARWINPADGGNFLLDMPGDIRGADSAGYLTGLQSFGTMAVELTGNNGQLLQIATGKTATVSIPIASSLAASAPASLSLWSFNDSTGLWKQEKPATKSGGSYVGVVSHFSFWDGATGIPLVNVTARIVDASSQPLANVAVSITVASMPQNAGYGQFAYTDASGYVTGAVFANTNLVLDILTPCALAAYSHPFSTFSSDIDLGTLTGNLGQNEVTISGTVTNCSSQPVTNGYVQTYDHGFYNRIPVNNGSFSFTGLACTNTVVDIVAVDNATNQQNTPQTVTLVPGVNALGALTACGTSTMGSLTFTIDGVTTTLTEPTDTIAAYLVVSQTTQLIVLSGNPNTNQQMSFNFDGGTAIGSAHSLGEVFCNKLPGGRGSWPIPIQLNITEYGNIGGFVAGNFSGNLVDFNNTAIHPITCTFRVRRYN